MGRPTKDGYKIKLPILQVLNQHEKIVASNTKVHVVGEGEGGKCLAKFGLCQLIINSCLIIGSDTEQPPIFVLKASETDSICQGSEACFAVSVSRYQSPPRKVK